MSQFVELPNMHLFQMSVISSPGIESIVTCIWALEWQDTFLTMRYSNDKIQVSLRYVRHVRVLFRQTLSGRRFQSSKSVFFFEGTVISFCWYEQKIVDRLKNCRKSSSSTTNLTLRCLESKPSLRDDRPAIDRLNCWHRFEICSLPN